MRRGWRLPDWGNSLDSKSFKDGLGVRDESLVEDFIVGDVRVTGGCVLSEIDKDFLQVLDCFDHRLREDPVLEGAKAVAAGELLAPGDSGLLKN